MLYTSSILMLYVLGFIGYFKYQKKLKHLQTQINNHQKVISSSPHIFNDEIKSQFGILKKIVNELDEELNQKIDKRTQALYTRIDTKQKENINNLRKILTNWENSEEFRMMLNSIKSKERKENNGVTY